MPKRAKSAKRPSQNSASSGPQRLQRILAAAGFGSRRQCEDLIQEGRVIVNGQTVTQLGSTADPKSDTILVDDSPIRPSRHVYYAVHKPTGVVTTNRDPQGRPRVIDLVPPDERVFPVGRLDRNSEGLILLTNDGDLAQQLAHPKFGVRKIYRVTVAGKVDGETMKQMRRGIHIAEGMVRVEGAKLLKTRGRSTELEIVLREGKNREIRRILARLGHKVQKLRRIAIGPLRLGDVPAGAYRALRHDEVAKLYASVQPGGDDDTSTRPGRRKGGKKPRQRSGNDGTRSKSTRPAAKKAAAKRSGRTPDPERRRRDERSDSSFPLPSSHRRIGAVIGGDAPEPADAPEGRPAKRSKKPSRKKAAKRSAASRSGSSRTGSQGRAAKRGTKKRAGNRSTGPKAANTKKRRRR
ncbi:pseudouridine synthase [Crateriforma conspicua]|uniref:Pseudouridine synthase n=1 Tax=Crateriforma conspicua TaxID=2527996 RepID=A0A5C6FVN6_9PLAN|nr:pseudouridine synthase [Crateriforma conspicua]TWU65685.1 Ribosomal large subunit pseudouridine synthase B [Crateriforma conspicua]